MRTSHTSLKTPLRHNTPEKLLNLTNSGPALGHHKPLRTLQAARISNSKSPPRPRIADPRKQCLAAVCTDINEDIHQAVSLRRRQPCAGQEMHDVAKVKIRREAFRSGGLCGASHHRSPPAQADTMRRA